MTDFNWDPFRGGAGAFAKFENIGDEAVGKILAIRVHTFDAAKGAVPLIDLESLNGGEDVTLAVDKVDLRMQVAAIAPQVGDLLAVKFVSTERTPNGTKKVFAVKHRQGERKPVDPFEDTQLPAQNAPFQDTEDLSAYSEEPF